MNLSFFTMSFLHSTICRINDPVKNGRNVIKAYNLVPLTTNVVTFVSQSITSNAAMTVCKNECGQLVFPNGALMKEYLKQQWTAVPVGKSHWIGGVSTTSSCKWEFPDGEFILVTLDLLSQSLGTLYLKLI